MSPHCLPTVHWGPKRPLQGVVASQGVHHLPLQQQRVFQTKGAALTLHRRVAVQGEAVRASGEVLRSPRLLEDSSWGSGCHTLDTPNTIDDVEDGDNAYTAYTGDIVDNVEYADTALTILTMLTQLRKFKTVSGSA